MFHKIVLSVRVLRGAFFRNSTPLFHALAWVGYYPPSGRMSPTRECRGRPALCRGLGCPQKPLFFSLAAYGGKQKERKRGFRGHPEPRQGGPCTPSGHPPVKEALPIRRDMLTLKHTIAKYLKVGPYGAVASALIAWSVAFRLILLLLNYPEVNSDEGTMGIEAMHIAFQGQHPIYLYGQDYMGVLEAYLAAPLFRLFGVSAFTLRLSMLVMFALFLLAMYWLGSLLYSKRLALVSLALLSLAASDMLIQQLRAVGGAIETILFGAWLFVIAYRLAASVKQRGMWRYLAYLAWGLAAGIGLWVHFLVLPFVLCSGLLILVFCYRDWYTLAIPCLLLGLYIGAYPLLQNYHLVLDTVLKIRSGSTVIDPTAHTYFLQQIISTTLWGIPLTTGVQPVCAYTDLPTYGPLDALTVPCSLLQGAWNVGYLLLLRIGLFTATSVCLR